MEAAGLDMEGMAESTASLRKEIKALSGVDIMIDDSTFKSTYKIIEELAAKWKDLTDIQQASLTELIAGKRQGNIVSAVMENFDIAQDTLETSLNSAGSAMQEYNIWLDSIEAKTNQFRAAFESLSNTLISSDSIKSVVDVGTNLLELLTKIVDKIGGIPALLTTVAGALSLFGEKTILSPFTVDSNFNIGGSVLDSFSIGTQLSKEVDMIKNYNRAITEASDLTEILANGNTRLDQIIADTMGSASTSTLKYVKAQNGAQIATSGLTKTLVLNKAASLAAAAGQAVLNAAWSMGISLLITGLITAISKLIEKIKESIQASKGIEYSVETVKELKSQFDSLSASVQSAANDYRDFRNSVDDIIPRFAELAKGVSALGENESLTNSEYQEFISLNNQIAEMFPELNLGMDSNGNAMLSLSYTADTLAESLWNMVEAERAAANAAIAEKMPETMSTLTDLTNQYKSQIEGVEDDIDTLISTMQDKAKSSYDFKLNTTSSDPDKIFRYSDAFYEYIDLLEKYGIAYDIKKANAASQWINVVIEDQEAAERILQEALDKQVAGIESQMQTQWKELNSIVNAWMQVNPLFDSLNDPMKEIAQYMVSGVDFSSLGLETAEQVQDYVQGSIIAPLFNCEADVKDAFAQITDWQEQLNSGDITEAEFAKNIKDSFDLMFESMNEDQVEEFKEYFVNGLNQMGISGESFTVVLDGLIAEWGKVSEATEESVESILHSYDDLKGTTKSAVDAQVALGKIFADNSSLTQEAYDALIDLVGSEEALAGCIDTTNGYLVTNAELLQDIVDGSNEVLLNNIKLAQSHEKLNYHELVNQLHDVTDGVEDYDDATLNTISTILDQIDVTKQQIAQYKLLEQQLLGVTNAFTEMENAQQIDEAADYTDDLAGMIQTLFDSYSNNEFGTETFWTAFKALVPEDIYGQFEDAGDQIEAGWDYLNNVLSRYYSSDDGNISIDFDNIKNFVTDGLNTAFGDSTVFTGTLENFELNPQIDTLEEFADAMNLTTTEAFALGNAISKYSADHEDFLSDLEVETLENQIYACDQAMAELLEKQTELGKAGKVGTDEWNALQTEIDETKAKMDELRASARENITAHINIDAEILEKQQEVDGLKADLETLDETDAEYEATMTNYVDAQNELATLLQQKYDLEAPTELTIQVALEQVQSEIAATQTELDKIAEFDGKTYTAKAGVDQTEVDDLVNKIAELEAEQSQIMIYAGIDDESVLSSLETIQNFVIDDKGFTVTFDNYKTTRDRLIDVKNVLAGINSKTIYVTTITRTQSARATGTAFASGNAYESGNWGTPTAEKDALVGELGEELVVDPRTGTYQTVGTNGAEFVDLPKGAIVFNHQQTKEILKNRRINSRGIAYANGNAHFTFLDRTYSIGEDSKPNPKPEDYKVNVKVDINLEEQLKETLEKMDEEINKALDAYEHKIFLLEKNDGDPSEIVAIYKQMQQEVHDQAEEYRALGLSENSEYIMNLQKQWWDYQDAIQEVVIAAYDEMVSAHENSISLTENLLEQAIESANASDISRYTGDIVEHYRDMQNAVHEQAEYYRSLGYAETSDEISQLTSLWWEYYDKIKTVSADAWEQVVDNANDALDNIQGMYDSLKNAAQEYAEYGYITVDSLQDILSYGVEYLAFLQDENGQLVINEANIQKVIAARTQQMAIESALNYIQQIRTALTNNDTVALLNLTTATSGAASSTWDLVYAQLQLLGLSGEQYNNALQRINVMRSLADSAVVSINRVDTSAKEALEETSTALEDLLKYVEEMIKQEVENQISALEDQIDKYREIVDLQKESLDLEREKDKYTKDVTEKTKSIAELQARIAQLDLDDSREAQAEKRKLQEQLAEEQSDLAETQADHAYEATSDMLDNMADAYEKEKQKEIAILEDSISSAEKIYQLAIDRINNHWDTLYDDLINWNYQYGNTVQSELISAWNAASGAVQQYGSYLNAVAATQAQIAAFDASSGFTTVGTMGDYDTSGGETMSRVKEIVAQMKANSKQHGSEDAAGQLRLNKENLRLGEELQKLIGRTVVRGNDGVWYLDKVGGAQLYSTYPYSTYHTGGIVGDDSTPKQDEMFALLKKREAVLTEPQQEITYRILKADETIAGKLGISGGLYHSMNGSGYAEMQSHNTVMRDMQQAQAASGGSHVSQSIGDVTVPVHVMVTEKLDKSDIRRLSKEISSVAAEGISEAFIKRGKGTLRDSLLKP